MYSKEKLQKESVLCSDRVEDGTHFICICENYKFQRNELLSKILITHLNFNNLSNIDKLAFSIKHEWKTLPQYCSCLSNKTKIENFNTGTYL